MPNLLKSLILLSLLPTICAADSLEAKKLVRESIDYWRGTTSRVEAEMTIHRPDWERTSSLTSFTKGTDLSLVRFTAPAKDAGNASLTVDETMWSFTPKINKVIKIPPSMMTQSWMGSDFSFNDLARSDDIVEQYNHRILGEETSAGQKVYLIEAIPLPEAPVVWGKEILKIRADKIMVLHEFYDQELKLIKRVDAIEIGPLGGRVYPLKMRMTQLNEADKWTEVVHRKGDFGIEISDSFFSLGSLKDPRVQ